METRALIHLKRRDRFAVAFRIVGALLGLVVIAVASLTASWTQVWVITLFSVIVVGGAFSYHVLTSIVSCPSCGSRMQNLGISSEDAKFKAFKCRQCGASSYLREGFYWQRDISG